jgi:1,4-alpha-glucan branching enzyme
MSISKQYLEGKAVCKVTFRMDDAVQKSAVKACVAGDFNNWSVSANPMKRMKNGKFTATLKLEKDREYAFRYLLDDRRWENDAAADKYIPTPYPDCQNGVIVL